MQRALRWLPAFLGLPMFIALMAQQWTRLIHGENDFVVLYVGAKLAGTADLYSRAVNLATLQSILGVKMDIVYIRPPFYAVLLKPLSFLPYWAAYAVFAALCVASIVWFVVRFTKECPVLPLCASLGIPVVAALLGGQDTPFLLVFMGGFILLTRRQKDFLAGLVLSLCAIKFHLFLFVPLMLLCKKRWRLIYGASCGVAALMAGGIAFTGIASLGKYLSILPDPRNNPNPDMTPNLHGLLSTLGGSGTLEAALTGILTLAFLWIVFHTDDLEILLAVSILCGLLASYHSGFPDDILLLVVLVLILHSTTFAPLRVTVVVGLIPLPLFLFLPFTTVFPLSLIAILAMVVVSLLARPAESSVGAALEASS